MADLCSQLADLSIHAHTPLPLAEATPLSSITDFYASGSFADYRKSVETKHKVQQAMFARFDAVIKGIGGLGKLLAKRR